MGSVLGAVATTWLAVACGSAWYAQVEINEGMDSTQADTAHRLLDLALHDLGNGTDGLTAGAHQPTFVQRGDSSLGDDHMVYQVVDASARVVMRSQDAPVAPLPVPLVNGFATLAQWRVYTFKHPELPLYIHVGDSIAHRHEAQWEITTWLLLPLVLGLPLLAVWVRFLIGRHLAPVQHLSTQIGMRNGHNLSAIPGSALPIELQNIADSTNHLLRRLSDALDTERSLAANAAHELRTPLSTTQFRLHTLLDLPLTPEARLEADKALEALTQLSRRAEKLLQMSRAESAATLSLAPVNLSALAGAVAQEFWVKEELLARVQLKVPAESDVIVSGDFDALAIVLRNLVENALRYSLGSVVEIEVRPPGTLQVRDFGPGVPPEQLDRIRLRHISQDRDGAGYGLGMSIVATIVARHGGHFELASPPAGYAAGFEATVVLQPST